MFRCFVLLLGWVCTGPLLAQQPYVLVLGTAQDGGHPHAGCGKECCRQAWQDAGQRHYVSCIAIIDPQTRQSWLVDATPDFAEQLHLLRAHLRDSTHMPSGILLTHAHIGHYTGLMHLGREVMGARQVPVYAMPRMKHYLETNGPWEQLVKLQNIVIHELADSQLVQLGAQVAVRPVRVPHRDEYSETVGFDIHAGAKRVLFIPDIDKWEKWKTPEALRTYLLAFDYCLLDGTFYRTSELPGRSMSEVPHPFVPETCALLKPYTPEQRHKIVFIHLNHTNPLLWDAAERKRFEATGFRCAEGMQELH